MLDLTCKHCGCDFTARAASVKGYGSRDYCSHDCYWQSMKSKTLRPCATCGAEFTVRPCNERKNIAKGGTGQKFCSRECWRASMRGETNPRYKGPHRFTCKHCGEAFERPPTWSPTMQYCSIRCRSLYLRAHPEESPNWKNGATKLQDARKDPLYIEWRKAVYARDDYTCQDCGERGGRLHAHHLYRWIDFPNLRLSVNNGRTLCAPCHLRIKGREMEYLQGLGLSHDQPPLLW